LEETLLIFRELLLLR
jgi:hypothetical protein